MITVVCFRVGDGQYAIPVEHVQEVRSGDQLVPLPSPRDGVVGLLHDHGRAITVLATFGPGEDHVVLLRHGDRTFGLAVGEVTSVSTVPDEIAAAPAGQRDELVTGVINTPTGLWLMVDIALLDARLDAVDVPEENTALSEIEHPGEVVHA